MSDLFQPTFFTVKYGENDEQLFNSDCYLTLLLRSIKQRCNCEEHDRLALADEQCEIINLSEYDGSLENGKPLFSGRGTYFLLAVKSNDAGGLRYKPLIDSDYIPSEVVERLEELSNPDPSLNRKRAKSKRGSVLSMSTNGSGRRKTPLRNTKVKTSQK